MSISKISRGIVVVIFAALIVFLEIMDFIYINKFSNLLQSTSFLYKIGYFALVLVLVLVYTYVRQKLQKLKLKKPISTLYRYTYLVLVMLATTFFKIYSTIEIYPIVTLILYFVLTYLEGFFVQRIIFNVSKSDVLSVFGMFMTYTFPNIIADKTINLNSKFIVVILFASIYIMQTLIDELKQLNIRNKKYIKQAILLGIYIGIGTLFGVNYLLWIAVGVISLFVTANLDHTNLNLSGRNTKNKIMKKKNNYFIYKVERIKVSKLLISLIIISIIATAIYFGGRILTHKLADNLNGVCGNIVTYITFGIHSNYDVSWYNIKSSAYAFVGLSTKFYIVCFTYILMMEILSFILHRKFDTKSTLIKFIFVVLYVLVTIFKINVIYYQPVLSFLLVIICIVNTTNIYYNREERIKMIEA